MARLTAGIAALIFAAFCSADTIVVPPPYSAAEGPEYLKLQGAGRILQVLDYSLFASLGPIEITGVSVRADATNVVTTAIPISLSVSLSTSGADPNTPLDSTFANNTGAGAIAVFSGTYTFATANSGSPKDFDLFIPFTTSFVYTPAAGANLVMDISTSAPVVNVAKTNYLRLDTSFGVQGGGLATLLGQGAAPATGTYSPGGLIGQFVYIPYVVPTPEPGTLALLAAGLAGLAVFGAHRGRRRG